MLLPLENHARSLAHSPQRLGASSASPTSLPFHAAISHQVRRQQEVRNPLLDRILVPAMPTHQLALGHGRLHEHVVQILERLRGLRLRVLAVAARRARLPQGLRLGRLLGQSREAELSNLDVSSASSEEEMEVIWDVEKGKG
jgi:hypothetical protein